VRFALGVSQGSISGPILFALYLSTLSEEIRSAVNPELRTVEYADDVNMWLRLRRNADNTYDTTQAQTALNVISTWSENYGINVSISDSIIDTKTYGFIYTTSHLAPALPVNLTYRGIPLAIKDEAKMLGVTFDHNLNFDKHIKKITNAAKLKLACINKIIGKDWGGSTGDTRSACTTQVLPLLTYACNVWAPLLNEGTLAILKCTVNYTARVIAGLHRPTDVDSLYLEANVLDIMKTVDDKVMAGVERHRRRPEGDPLRVKALGPTPRVRANKTRHRQCWQQYSDRIQERHNVLTRRHRINVATGELRNTFFYSADAIRENDADIYFLHRAPLDDPHTSTRPEEAEDIKVRFYPHLTNPVSATTPTDEKLRNAMATIRLLRRRARGAVWELWTDGAVEQRTGAGAAQQYLTSNSLEPEWTQTDPAGNCTDPLAAESLAVLKGLTRITTMDEPGPTNKVIIVYTDSQGLVTALEKGPIRQRDAQLAAIWKHLYLLFELGAKRVVFQWIPSHCGIPRNENADAVAREALHSYSINIQRRVPVRYQNIVSYYKEKNKAYYQTALQTNDGIRSTLTTAPANLSQDNALGRRGQVKLAQLRTGVCNTMGWYQRIVDDGFHENHNKSCRWCGLVNETIIHVYNECEDLQLIGLRHDISTATGRTLNAACLVTDPTSALAFHDRAIGFIQRRGGTVA